MRDDQFSEFVRQRGADLLRVAYLLCGDAQRAEDVVQDALLDVMRQWRKAAPDHPFAYARRAVVNEYLGWRRRRAAHELVGTEGFDLPTPDASEAIDDRDLVWRMISALPPRSRAVLVLRYYEQLPDREIAAQLGCAEPTVRSIAARAFAVLRAHPQLEPLTKEA